jgi:hypothetical protein
VHREIEGQLALRDTSERRPFEEALLARRCGPLPLVPVVCFGLLAGVVCLLLALVVAREPAREGGLRPRPPSLGEVIALVLAGAAGVGLLARAWPLFMLSPAAASAVAAVGLVVLAASVRGAMTWRPLVAPAARRAVRELAVLPATTSRAPRTGSSVASSRWLRASSSWRRVSPPSG